MTTILTIWASLLVGFVLSAIWTGFHRFAEIDLRDEQEPS